MNTAELKVGITSLKTLRDRRILIETSSRNDINILGIKIREECAENMADAKKT